MTILSIRKDEVIHKKKKNEERREKELSSRHATLERRCMDVAWTLHGCWNDVKTLKRRRNNVVLTSCTNWKNVGNHDKLRKVPHHFWARTRNSVLARTSYLLMEMIDVLVGQPIS